MAINYKAYRDANGEIRLIQDGTAEDILAAADGTLVRLPGADTTTSNDGNTNETALSPTQISQASTEIAAEAPVQSVGGEVGVITLADLNLDQLDNTSDANKPISTATQTALNNKYDASNPSSFETPTQLNNRDTDNRNRTNHTGTQTSSTISDFDTSVDGRISIQKASPSGLATLDGTGKIPAVQLPSFVDDVLEFPNLASFPVTGESGKIYVDIDTNKQYRWSGSTYIDLTGTVITQHSQLTLDDGTNPHGTNKTDVGLGNVSNLAPADLPISTATQTALNEKISRDGSIDFNQNQSMGNNKLINLATPTNGSDATNKTYVDNQISSSSAADRDRANHTNTQPITTLTEAPTPTGALANAFYSLKINAAGDGYEFWREFEDFLKENQPKLNQTTTMGNYMTFTPNVPVNGFYEISVTMIWSLNATDTDLNAELVVGGDTSVFINQEPKDAAGTGVTAQNINGGSNNTGTNQRHPVTWTETYSLSAGNVPIALNFRQSGFSNDEATIYEAEIRIKRIKKV